MATIPHISIKPSQQSDTPARIQNPSPSPTTPTKDAKREEPPFSHLWKGICDFFTGNFKPNEEHLWEKKARRQEEEIVALKAKLQSNSESLESMERFVAQKVQGGAKEIEKYLTAHTETTHANREKELELVSALFKRHEEVFIEYLRYKQGYEALANDYRALEKEYNALGEHDRMVMLQNERLAADKIKFENLYKQERDKVTLYERAWYGMGSGSSSSSS